MSAGPGVAAATTAMGTWFEVRVSDGRPGDRAAAEAALEVIEDAHRRFSRFEASSLVSHLARVAPTPVAVDRDTFLLFQDVERVGRESGGAFAVTGRADDPRCRLDERAQTVALMEPVPLDLGAIAKGHAIDLAARALREAGVEVGFVHGGTSSGYGLGIPPNGPWRIRLGPDGPVVPIENRAFSVSSTADRAHITDPRTGRPAPRGSRVAVLGPTARLADAWSTALLVLGAGSLRLGSEWTVWRAGRRGTWRELDARAIG